MGPSDFHTVLWVRELFRVCRFPKARKCAPEDLTDRERVLCREGLAKVKACDDIKVVS